jgi:uncharacterized C2H2 Zn-finger protein
MASNKNCGLCPFKSKTKEELQLHISVSHRDIFTTITVPHHEEDLPYETKPLPETLNPALALPLTNASSKGCGTCGKTFSSRYNLQRHVDVVHLKKTTSRCQICGTLLNSESSLKTHIQEVHKRDKKFECSVCQKSYAVRFRLVSHVRRVHLKDARVRAAANTYEAQNSGKIQCKTCNKNFPSVFSFKRHVNAAHLPKTGSCRTDGGTKGTILSKPTLTTAIEASSKEKNIEFKTEIYEVTQTEAAITFVNNEHQDQPRLHKPPIKEETLPVKLATTEKFLCCEICSQLFPSRLKLQRHIKQTHLSLQNETTIKAYHYQANEKELNCLTCNRRFSNRFRCQCYRTFFGVIYVTMFIFR